MLYDYLEALVNDYTLRTISLGTLLLGVVCGLLGSFAVLRKQSLLGDAISHAALPGIALAFMLTGIKDPWMLFFGAAISGLLGSWWISLIRRYSPLSSDTALGIVLSVFFGFGMLLLTFIQKQPNANQAGLDRFLFGQAATLLEADVLLIGAVALGSLLFLILFWKEFKIISFDPAYAQTLGIPVRRLDFLLNALIVFAIVVGLQTVGVVLMSALLLAPAAAARQWTNRLGRMLLLGALFGGLAGLGGTAVSASAAQLPTGPVIVLFAVGIVAFSFLFAPQRGLLWRSWKQRQQRKDFHLKRTLNDLYAIEKQDKREDKVHFLSELPQSELWIRQLAQEQLVQLKGQRWQLTEAGWQRAEQLFQR